MHNVYKALGKLDDIESLIYNFEGSYPEFKQLEKVAQEFRMYIGTTKTSFPIMASAGNAGRPL